MNDESFSENFVWFEWGFVAPEELRADDAEMAGASRSERVDPTPGSTGWDTVWMHEYP
jgi:hypothetical protein